MMKQQEKGIFDSPKNVNRVLQFLYGGCFLLFVADFLVHRHISHYWENIWAFYPLYGFVSCVVLVIIASWMRPFLIRSEDYYSDEGLTEDQIAQRLKTTEHQTEKQVKGGSHVDD
jgi:hypothetical protein